MSSVRGRRHYRVAQKEVEQAPQKGTFVKNEDKHKLCICALLFVMIVFIKGFVIGYLLGRQENE